MFQNRRILIYLLKFKEAPSPLLMNEIIRKENEKKLKRRLEKVIFGTILPLSGSLSFSTERKSG